MCQHGALCIFGDQNHAGPGLSGNLGNFDGHPQISHIFQPEFSQFIAPRFPCVSPLATEVDQAGDRVGGGSPRAAIDFGATNGVEDASLCRFVHQCHNSFLKLQKIQGGIIDSSLNINEGITDSVNIVTGGHEKTFQRNCSTTHAANDATSIVPGLALCRAKHHRGIGCI